MQHQMVMCLKASRPSEAAAAASCPVASRPQAREGIRLLQRAQQEAEEP